MLRAWVGLAIALVIALHYVALYFFPEYKIEINKWIGLALQVTGGLIVLFAVNENLALFRKKSIFGATRDWAIDIPRDRPTQIVSLGGSASFNFGAAGGVTVTIRPVPKTLEDRVANIESDLHSFKKLLESTKVEIRADVEGMRANLQQDVSAISTQLQEAKFKIEETAIGGFKLQVFGVLLANYGAIVSIAA